MSQSRSSRRTGHTIAATEGAQVPTHAGHPRLPHEHDQSSDSQVLANPEATRKMRQAAHDLSRGLVDTDRGPIIDRLRREHFGGDDPAPTRRRRPR